MAFASNRVDIPVALRDGAGVRDARWDHHAVLVRHVDIDGHGELRRHKYADRPTGVWRQMTVRADWFPPNAWGLYSVHGNVWDWTEDCWSESNAGNPGDGTARLTGDCTWRVARGGAWNYAPTYLRSAYRYWNLPNNRSSVQGMRVVREL